MIIVYEHDSLPHHAMNCSRPWKMEWKWKSLSHVQLFGSPTDSTVHGILQARILEWVPFPSPGDLPNPGIEPRSLTLQADSLQAKPQGKPKNTGVGSLFLLQQIFPTQELNWNLLHCIYQLSYQGSQNGLFPAISVNKGCHSYQQLQQPWMVSW